MKNKLWKNMVYILDYDKFEITDEMEEIINSI